MRMLVVVVTMMLVLFLANLGFCQTLDAEVEGNFTNEDVPTIVSQLASQAGFAVYFDPAVTGKLGINFQGRTLGSALDEISILTGYFYKQVSERSIIFATADPKGPYFKDISESEVVGVKFAKVKQVMSAFSVCPSLLAYIAPDDGYNQLLITAPRPIIEQIKQIVTACDLERENVKIKVLVTDESGINNKERTAQFKFTRGETSSNGITTITTNNISFGIHYKRSDEYIANVFGSVSADKLKILSKTEITVPDCETGEENFGKTYYAPTATYYPSDVPAKLQEILSGNSLKVRPRIIKVSSDDQRIELTVRVEASEPVGVGPYNLPVLNRRYYEGTVIVRNKETYVLSVLDNMSDYKFKSKPPILGEIPLLGELLKTTRNRAEKQMIFIYITPTILSLDENQE